jgi:hypothetical protein
LTNINDTLPSSKLEDTLTSSKLNDNTPSAKLHNKPANSLWLSYSVQIIIFKMSDAMRTISQLAAYQAVDVDPTLRDAFGSLHLHGKTSQLRTRSSPWRSSLNQSTINEYNVDKFGFVALQPPMAVGEERYPDKYLDLLKGSVPDYSTPLAGRRNSPSFSNHTANFFPRPKKANWWTQKAAKPQLFSTPSRITLRDLYDVTTNDLKHTTNTNFDDVGCAEIRRTPHPVRVDLQRRVVPKAPKGDDWLLRIILRDEYESFEDEETVVPPCDCRACSV